ncbi:MAG: SapC family protein [Thermodesulfobacteriota bacterium]
MYDNLRMLDKSCPFKFTADADYRFAAKLNFCPVYLQELPQIVREYFICFPDNRTDLPHVVLGFERLKNRYVAEDGTWLVDYVPAHIRRYPFALAVDNNSQPGGTQFRVAVDVDAPQLSTEGGKELFTVDGKPSEVLRERIDFLQAVEKQRITTQKAVQKIARADLFQIKKMHVRSANRSVSAISGIRMVDEQKLPDVDMKPGPALELIYAHLFSKANLRYGILADKQGPSSDVADAISGFSFADDILRFE